MATIKTLKRGLDTSGTEPIWWCDGSKPRRYSKTVKEAGIAAIEQLPQAPHRPFVNLAGSLINMSLTSGASNRSVNHPESQGRVNRKMRKGFVPADECPMATNRMPPDLLERDKNGAIVDKVCAGYVADDGYTAIRKPEPCKHVKRIMSVRKKKHEELADQYKERFLTNQDKMLAALLRREERELEDDK